MWTPSLTQWIFFSSPHNGCELSGRELARHERCKEPATVASLPDGAASPVRSPIGIPAGQRVVGRHQFNLEHACGAPTNDSDHSSDGPFYFSSNTILANPLVIFTGFISSILLNTMITTSSSTNLAIWVAKPLISPSWWVTFRPSISPMNQP